MTAQVNGGKIKCAWEVVYKEDDNNLKQEKAEKDCSMPEYGFTVECGVVTSGESRRLDVMGWIRTQYINKRMTENITGRKCCRCVQYS